MKHLQIIMAFTLMLTTMASTCQKDDDVISQTGNTKVPEIVSQGTWRVTQYNDSGVDELYHFTNYNFTFNNGVITASKNGSVVNGTYSTKFDDSKNKFVLNFGTTIPFDELNDDWHIIEETASKVKLQDVSGGNGGTDLLTFEKN